jgi:hypothetical protein
MVLDGEHKRTLNLRKKLLHSEGTPEEDESDV